MSWETDEWEAEARVKPSSYTKKGIDWVILSATDLEDKNCHSVVSIPEKLYNELVKIVPSDKHDELGKTIYECFKNVW